MMFWLFVDLAKTNWLDGIEFHTALRYDGGDTTHIRCRFVRVRQVVFSYI